MVVAAIDTSQQRGSVAIARDGQLLDGAVFGDDSSHLLELGRTLDLLLTEQGLDACDIERVALVVGPGSFTGLRIGMAFVKGLYAGLGMDVVTIGTLTLLALPHLEKHATVCTMLDARKREVYGAMFARPAGSGEPLAAAMVLVDPCATPAALFLERLPETPALFIGSGVERYRGDVDAVAGDAAFAAPLDEAPSSRHLSRIAHHLTPLSRDEIRSLEPDYVRSSEAELKRLKDGSSQ